MSSKNLEFTTFAITFRPHNGVTDDMIERFEKWCRPRCKYGKIITEKEGSERHVHAFMITHKPQQTPIVRRSLLNAFSDLSKEERIVLGRGVTTSYNGGWLEYLAKGDSTVVLYEDLPEVAHMESYFPPKTDNTAKPGRKPSQSYYGRLETLWFQHGAPGTQVNPENMRHFLFSMMYKERLIDVMRDDRTIMQASRHLARFINKCDSSHLDVPMFEIDK